MFSILKYLFTGIFGKICSLGFFASQNLSLRLVYCVMRGEQQRFRKSAKLAARVKRGQISHSFEVVASLRVTHTIFHNLSFENLA